MLEAGPRGEATPSETTPRERGAERPPSDAPPRGRARARGVTTTERERRAGASVAGAAEIEAIAGEGLRRNERRESMRGREPSAASRTCVGRGTRGRTRGRFELFRGETDDDVCYLYVADVSTRKYLSTRTTVTEKLRAGSSRARAGGEESRRLLFARSFHSLGSRAASGVSTLKSSICITWRTVRRYVSSRPLEGANKKRIGIVPLALYMCCLRSPLLALSSQSFTPSSPASSGRSSRAFPR